MRLLGFLIIPFIHKPASFFSGATSLRSNVGADNNSLDFSRRLEEEDEPSGHCIPQQWEYVPDCKIQYAVTSADSYHLWGIDVNGKVHYRQGFSNWIPVPFEAPFESLSVSGDGQIIWGITTDQNDVYREGGLEGTWQYVDDNAKNWCHISVSADGEHVAATDEAGGVWDRKGINNPWFKRSGSLKMISYNGNGEIGWAVDENGGVFYRGGYLEKWEQLSGNLKFVSVSADGNHVWGVNNNDIIFYRNGKDDFWKSMPGRAKMISVSGDGQHVYSVDRRNYVHHINGYPGFFQEDTRALRNVGKNMTEVSVSHSGQEIYGVDADNNLWHTDGIDMPWTLVGGAEAGVKSVSVVNEDELWAVTSDDKSIWRQHENAPFVELTGTLVYVEGSANGQHLWGINKHYVMYYRPGKTSTSWWQSVNDPTARAKKVSVNADGSQVWFVNHENEVFYRDGFEGTTKVVPGVRLKQIAVSGNGSHVWGVSPKKELYYRAGFDGKWIKAGGPLVDYVSVNNDGTVLYSVNHHDGRTYYRFC